MSVHRRRRGVPVPRHPPTKVTIVGDHWENSGPLLAHKILGPRPPPSPPLIFPCSYALSPSRSTVPARKKMVHAACSAIDLSTHGDMDFPGHLVHALPWLSVCRGVCHVFLDIPSGGWGGGRQATHRQTHATLTPLRSKLHNRVSFNLRLRLNWWGGVDVRCGEVR